METIEVKLSEPLYKALVRAGLIESNREAKELFKSGAVCILSTQNKHSNIRTATLSDTIELLLEAAKQGLYLKIGKRFVEKLELVREEK